MTYTTVYKEIDVEVEVDMDDFDDEDIKHEYEKRFGTRNMYASPSWLGMYEKRRSLPDKEFLKLIDKVIMDMTGRIL